MTGGAIYNLQSFQLSILVFGDSDGIVMVIGSNCQKGSEAMTEASILMIYEILILALIGIYLP